MACIQAIVEDLGIFTDVFGVREWNSWSLELFRSKKKKKKKSNQNKKEQQQNTKTNEQKHPDLRWEFPVVQMSSILKAK